MNAPGHLLPPDLPDPDVTDELPALDLAAYEARAGRDSLASTDTWAVQSLTATAVLPQGLMSQSQEPEPAIPSLRIEDDLKSLAVSLQDLEGRLAAKGEKLSAIEAELGQARAAGAAAHARAEALGVELSGTQAQLAAASARRQELEDTLLAAEADMRAAAARETELQTLLSRREGEVRTATGRHEAAAASLQQRLQLLESQCAGQLEALQSLEGRRGIFDTQLRGLDAQISERDRRLQELEAQLARGGAQAGEMGAALAAHRQHIGALEAEVAQLSASLGVRTEEAAAAARNNQELVGEVRTLTAQCAAYTDRIGELEAAAAAGVQAHTQAQQASAAAQQELAHGHAAARQELTQAHAAELQQLKQEHAAALQELGQANTRLRREGAQMAAELEELRAQSAEHVAAVQQVTAEHAGRMVQLAAKDTRIQELTAKLAGLERANAQMSEEIEAARHWLDGRDSLMQRLASEAAHSAVLVDNIQRSIHSLAPGATDSHEIAPLAGAPLLLRMEDGQEVIHALGHKTSIGRTPDNDLQIDAGFISRHHAVILCSATHTVIEDLNSTNGVLVNGRRVTRQVLNDGDALVIGKMKFKFVMRQEAGPAGDAPQP